MSSSAGGDILEGGSLGRLMFTNLRALATSRAGVTLIQFVAFATLAGHLGARRLGIYSFAVVLSTLFKPFSNFGFRTVTTREVAQDRADARVVVPSLVYLRLLIGFGIYGVLVLTVLVGGYSHAEQTAALVAGIAVMVAALDGFETVLEVKLRLGWVSLADMTEAVVFCTGVIVLSFRGAGPIPFLWLYVGANLLNMVIVMAAALRLQSFQWRPQLSRCLPIVRSSIPLGLAGLFIALYYRMDLAILAALKSSADVGQYGVGYKFLETLNVLPGLGMSVLNPVLARSVLLGHDVLQRRYSAAVHVMTLGGLYVAVGGAMTATRTLPVLPGFAGYHGAGVSLALLSPAAALIFLGTVLSGVMVNAHLQRKLFVISGVVLVVNLGLNLALIPPYSYRGAALATTLSEGAVVAASLWVIHRHLHLHWPLRRLRQSLMATGVLALALLPGYYLHPFAQLAIGTVCFAAALLPTGAITFSDLAAILPKGGRTTAILAEGAPDELQLTDLQLEDPDEVVDLRHPTGEPVDRRSVRALRRRIKGASRCIVIAGSGSHITALCLAARLAGCRSVDVVVPSSGGAPPRRPIWQMLVDQVGPQTLASP